jgi:hypothetical protein
MTAVETPKTETVKNAAPNEADRTAAVAAAETPAAPVKKGKQVSATVSADLYTFLDELHWSKRMSLTDMNRVAIEEYAVKNGYTPKA